MKVKKEKKKKKLYQYSYQFKIISVCTFFKKYSCALIPAN